MTNERFTGLDRLAFEEMAKMRLKEKQVPISEENIESEVWDLVIYAASVAASHSRRNR